MFVVSELGVPQQSDSFCQTQRVQSFNQAFDCTSTQLQTHTNVYSELQPSQSRALQLNVEMKSFYRISLCCSTHIHHQEEPMTFSLFQFLFYRKSPPGALRCTLATRQ